MALFPAYSQSNVLVNSEEDSREKPDDDNDLDWLTNESYKIASGSQEEKQPEKTKTDNEGGQQVVTIDGSDNSSSPVEIISTDLHGSRVNDYSPTSPVHRKRKQKHRSRSSSPKDRSRRKKKEKKHRRHRSRSKSKEKSEGKVDYNELLREKIAEHSKNKIFLEEVGLKPEHAFRVDRKPDKNNLRFTSFTTTHVARYKRMFPTSRCKYMWKLQTESQHVNDDPDGDSGEEHVMIDHSEEGGGLNYMSISDTSHPTNIFPSKSSKEDSDTSKFNNIHQRTASFNERLRDDPRSVSLWLEYIRFQDEATSEDKLSPHSLLEKKLSILEKALEHNPGSLDLLLEKMELIKHGREGGDVAKEWRRLVGAHPTRLDLWRGYLKFCRTQLSTFVFTQLMGTYQKCFAKMVQMQKPHFSEHQRPAHLEEHMLDILFELCILFKQTGHIERAVATLQALIELNFFRPSSLPHEASDEDLRLFFEPFWDSGVPRFGEKGAVGWSAVMEKKEALLGAESSFVKDDEAQNAEDALLETNLPLQDKWLRIEQLRESSQWLPWRLDPSEDECEDPLRAVLFDDVSPFLFLLPFSSSHLHFRLVLTFLHVFIPGSLLSQGSAERISSGRDLTWTVDDPGVFVMTEDVLGVAAVRFESPPFPLMKMETCVSKEVKEFVRTAMQKAQGLLEEPFRTALLVEWIRTERRMVRMESAGDVKQLRRLVKALLKEESNRNNLLLFREYALLEREALGLVEASHILQSILSACGKTSLDPTATQSEKAIICSLTRLLVETQILAGDNTSALKTLTSLACGEEHEPSPPHLLRAQRRFQEFTSELLSDLGSHSTDMPYQMPDLLVEWVVCHAWLAYLIKGLEEAGKVYKEALEVVVPGEMLEERIRFMKVVLWDMSIVLLLHNNYSTHYSTFPSSVQPRLDPPVNFPSPEAAKTNSASWATAVMNRVRTGRNIFCAPIICTFDIKLSSNNGGAEYVPSSPHLIHYCCGPACIVRLGFFRSCRELNEFRALVERMAQVKGCLVPPFYIADCALVLPFTSVGKHHIREQLLEAHVAVHIIAMQSTPSKYALCKKTLSDALQEYPYNMRLLGTVVGFETQCSVAGSLWRQLVTLSTRAISPVLPLHLALLLLQREKVEGAGAIGVTRKLFWLLERSTGNEPQNACPLLWRLLLKLSRLAGDVKRCRSLWYLALQNCPGVKALYLDAVECAPEELQVVVDLMTEKQLHVRFPLEELSELLKPVGEKVEMEEDEEEKDEEGKEVDGEDDEEKVEKKNEGEEEEKMPDSAPVLPDVQQVT